MKILVFTQVPNITLENQQYERYQTISHTHTYEELFEIAKRNLVDMLYSMGMFPSVIEVVKGITLEEYLLYEFPNKSDLERNVRLHMYNAMMGMLESEIKYMVALRDTKTFKEKRKSVFEKIIMKLKNLLRF
jgi:N-acetyl-gamma-glutamylphosphate reductase